MRSSIGKWTNRQILHGRASNAPVFVGIRTNDRLVLRPSQPPSHPLHRRPLRPRWEVLLDSIAAAALVSLNAEVLDAVQSAASRREKLSEARQGRCRLRGPCVLAARRSCVITVLITFLARVLRKDVKSYSKGASIAPWVKPSGGVGW